MHVQCLNPGVEYAELVCRSNHSFLQGASHPEELVAQAGALGLSALALGDQDGLYGTVKAHLAAREAGVRMLIASRVTITDGPELVLLARDAQGYANLCRLLSHSRLRHPKGRAGLPWREVAELAGGLHAILPFPDAVARVAPLAEAFAGHFDVGLCRTLSAGDEARVARAVSLAGELGVPLCAHNDVHTHAPRSPAAAGRAHRHPPRGPPLRRRDAPLPQRRAHPQVPGGDPAPLRRLPPRRWRARWRSPTGAGPRWTSCATSSPASTSPRATPRSPG